MTEKAPMGEMRLKVKDITLPADTVKELGDLIPKPEDHFHYRITGEWQPNREVYGVQEGDKVISDYSFPEKADMNVVQFATRKTYTKELNMWGNLKDKPVKFDRKTGTWKKLNFFESIKYVFNKETDIPAQVVTESINGKDVSVLHTLEQKRPVGKSVQEAQLGTIQAARVDLGLKYKFIQHEMMQLRNVNRKLHEEISSLRSRISILNARLISAGISAIDMNTSSSNYWESRTSSRSDEPPTYGNITPSETTVKKSKPPERTPPKKDEKLDKRGDDVISQFEKNAELRTKTAGEVRTWLAAEEANVKHAQMAREVRQQLEDGSILFAPKKRTDISDSFNALRTAIQIKGDISPKEAVVLEIRESCQASDLQEDTVFLESLYRMRKDIPNEKLFTTAMLGRRVVQDPSIGAFPKG